MERPNFLFIMTDPQATNTVGYYSGKPLKTQNIDALAAESIRFNSAYTCVPVCTPARAGLFTGIYSNQFVPWTNNVAPEKISQPWDVIFRMPVTKPCISANGISTDMIISVPACTLWNGMTGISSIA